MKYPLAEVYVKCKPKSLKKWILKNGGKISDPYWSKAHPYVQFDSYDQTFNTDTFPEGSYKVAKDIKDFKKYFKETDKLSPSSIDFLKRNAEEGLKKYTNQCFGVY